MSREIEPRSTSESEISREGFAFPDVNRDEQGRIIWSLPENSPEQNELIGINNVLGLFIERYPGFLSTFSFGEDDKILEGQREDAEEFVTDNIGTKKKFNANIYSSSRLKISAPYFEGSRFVVIRKSFAIWGLNFEELSKTPSQQDNWVHIALIHSEFRLPYGTINQFLDGVPSKKGRSSNGKLVDLYAREILANRVKEYLMRRASRVNRKITDEEGITWVTLRTVCDDKKIDRKTLMRMIDDSVETMIGRDKNGKRRTFYNESRLIELIERRTVVPEIEIDDDTEEYTDTEGVLWVSIQNFSENIGKNKATIYRLLENVGAPCMLARRKGTNSRLTLVDKVKLLEVLRQRDQRKDIGYWTPETIEREAVEFYIKHGDFNSSLLRRFDRNDLGGAIANHYPEGYAALKNAIREKLGIPNVASSTEVISPEQANEELMRFLEVEDE